MYYIVPKGQKQKTVKIKVGVTIGQERHPSRKCRAAVERTPTSKDVIIIIIVVVVVVVRWYRSPT